MTCEEAVEAVAEMVTNEWDRPPSWDVLEDGHWKVWADCGPDGKDLLCVVGYVEPPRLFLEFTVGEYVDGDWEPVTDCPLGVELTDPAILEDFLEEMESSGVEAGETMATAFRSLFK